MKVLNTNLFITQNPSFVKQRSFSPVFKGLAPAKTDRAEFNLSPEERALSKINKITKEEYDSLTKDEKLILREKSAKYIKELIGRDLKEDILIHQNAAEAIKQVFDKQYGKENYAVIPIGRSLSSIGKMLALKIGEENVKNIPMNAMQRYFTYAKDPDYYDIVTKDFASINGFEQFKDYLASIGLTKENVENSNKHYIIMDYTESGKSLAAAYTVLTSDYLLGNEKRNFEKVSNNDVLNPVKNKNHCLTVLDSLLDHSAFKTYSLISSVYNDFTDVQKAADYRIMLKNHPKTLKMKKYFGFALLDSEFGGKNKPSCKFKIESLKDTGLKNQDKKIWNSPDTQFVEDVDKDSREISKMIIRLEKPINEYSLAKSKYDYSSRDEIENITRKLKKEIQAKFPLEFEYYNNQKSFEKIVLSKKDAEKFTPLIYQKVKGFEEESCLYKFFEETDKKLKSFISSESEEGKESQIHEIKKAYNLLLKCAKDIKPFQECSYDIENYLSVSMKFSKCEKDSDEFRFMQKFYDETHSRINKILCEISQEYTPEKCKEYAESMDAGFTQAAIERDEKNSAFLSEMSKKLSGIKISHNQNDMKLALEKQKNALAQVYDSMLPF